MFTYPRVSIKKNLTCETIRLLGERPCVALPQFSFHVSELSGSDPLYGQTNKTYILEVQLLRNYGGSGTSNAGLVKPNHRVG